MLIACDAATQHRERARLPYLCLEHLLASPVLATVSCPARLASPNPTPGARTDPGNATRLDQSATASRWSDRGRRPFIVIIRGIDLIGMSSLPRDSDIGLAAPGNAWLDRGLVAMGIRGLDSCIAKHMLRVA